MRRFRVVPTACVLLIGVANVAEARTLPIYEITAGPKADATRLAKRLGLKGTPGANGLRFRSSRFSRLPTRQRTGGRSSASSLGPDVQAFKQARLPAASRTSVPFAALLADLGLRPAGSRLRSRVNTATLYAKTGERLARAPTGRHVDIEPVLSGIPVVGPRARISATWGPDGRLTGAKYTLPELRAGAPVQLLDPAVVDAQARDLLRGCSPATAPATPVTRRLVYHAPATPSKSTKLFPRYLYKPARARSFALPATADRPVVTLSTAANGSRVEAKLEITGGRAPYRVSWTSCSAPLPAEVANRPAIAYDVPPRGMGDPYDETVLASVTDADGQIAPARATVAVQPSAAVPPSAQAADRRGSRAKSAQANGDADDTGPYNAKYGEVGATWIGFSQGLPLGGVNAGLFVSRAFSAQWQIRYFEGEFGVDKKDFLPASPNLPGTEIVDDVDLAFHTSHADGTGWSHFSLVPPAPPLKPGDAPRYPSVGYADDMKLGDGDLEWLVIAACGPLQPEGSIGPAGESLESPAERWGPVFDGLHMLIGYANESEEAMLEGYDFAARALHRVVDPTRQSIPNPSTLGNTSVRDAWIDAAVGNQPAGVMWALMYPVSFSGRSNAGDVTGSSGTVTPDIRSADIAGFVVESGYV